MLAQHSPTVTPLQPDHPEIRYQKHHKVANSGKVSAELQLQSLLIEIRNISTFSHEAEIFYSSIVELSTRAGLQPFKVLSGLIELAFPDPKR